MIRLAVLVPAFIFGLAVGCTEDSADGKGSEGGATEAEGSAEDEGTSPMCIPPEPCGGEMTFYPSPFNGGWGRLEDGGDALFLLFSAPATACGNTSPGSCDDCGYYDALELRIPLTADQLGEYDLEGMDDMGARNWCRSTLGDCESNGETDGGGGNAFGMITITEISDTCIRGEARSVGCGNGSFDFAVPRCE